MLLLFFALLVGQHREGQLHKGDDRHEQGPTVGKGHRAAQVFGEQEGDGRAQRGQDAGQPHAAALAKQAKQGKRTAQQGDQRQQQVDQRPCALLGACQRGFGLLQLFRLRRGAGGRGVLRASQRGLGFL